MNDMSPAAHDMAAKAGRQDVGADARRMTRRKRLFLALLGGIAVVGAGYYGYRVLTSTEVSTDNAYVGADTASITPLIGGPVRHVLVTNTEMVRKGQVLVQLDDTDARIALARAEANLASTKRNVRVLIANDAELVAQVAARRAEAVQADANLAAARAGLAKAKIDLARRSTIPMRALRWPVPRPILPAPSATSAC